MTEQVIDPITPEQLDKWVAALRSGEYLQGGGQLKREADGKTYYCCLGVLLEVCNMKSVSDAYLRVYENNPELSATERQSLLLSPTTQKTLAHMNDCGNKTFRDIADYIEANILPELPE